MNGILKDVYAGAPVSQSNDETPMMAAIKKKRRKGKAGARLDQSRDDS
jgi:hypothetical protein